MSRCDMAVDHTSPPRMRILALLKRCDDLRQRSDMLCRASSTAIKALHRLERPCRWPPPVSDGTDEPSVHDQLRVLSAPMLVNVLNEVHAAASTAKGAADRRVVAVALLLIRNELRAREFSVFS